jgi:hypothetical protein
MRRGQQRKIERLKCKIQNYNVKRKVENPVIITEGGHPDRTKRAGGSGGLDEKI